MKSVDKLADTIREAFVIAKSGRPGPVLVDIPKDVQVAKCPYQPSPVVEKKPLRLAKGDKLTKAAQMIAEAEKPYIYFGGGAVSADISHEIIRLANKIDAPIGCTMMGLSCIPVDNPRYLGMEGMHGHYSSSVGQDEADLIITIGARFSDRATGNVSKYARKAQIIHIDGDSAEISKNVAVELGIACDMKDALDRLIDLVSEKKHPAWMARIAELKAEEAEQFKRVTATDRITPYSLIMETAKRANADTPIVTDVGQHQMWVAQFYPFQSARTFISSGGLGTMGFGLGAAIGAAKATKKRTILFTGDGSFGMNLNELATASTENVPVVIVIMNNHVLGMVRQWQTLFFNKHYSNTDLHERKTDFMKLADAFGMKGYRITELSELSPVLDQAFAEQGPVLVECMIDQDEFVLPMLPPGGCIEDIITETEGGDK